MLPIGHTNPQERQAERQADADFYRARRRAFLRRIAARLRNDPAASWLLSFEEARTASGLRNLPYVEKETVAAEKIVGSVGRARDFDRAFLPTTPGVEERWKRINRAFLRAEKLPPVRLNRVGDAYFVVDGNHRVSVARFHGVEWIDAEVVECHASGERVMESLPSPQDRTTTKETGG